VTLGTPTSFHLTRGLREQGYRDDKYEQVSHHNVPSAAQEPIGLRAPQACTYDAKPSSVMQSFVESLTVGLSRNKAERTLTLFWDLQAGAFM
jgi:hypothetical protein